MIQDEEMTVEDNQELVVEEEEKEDQLKKKSITENEKEINVEEKKGK